MCVLPDALLEKEFICQKVLPDFDWTRFDQPAQPVPLPKPITQCRVALVATAGAYLRGNQQPFATKSPTGDDSFRIIPNESPLGEIALSHLGYNIRKALQDLEYVFPLACSTDSSNRKKSAPPRPDTFPSSGLFLKPNG